VLQFGIVGEKVLLGDIEYVHTYIICQHDKLDTKRQGGLLHSLPILERPWMSVSMEFITQLPQAQGYNGILVIVDHFSKYVVFIPTKMPCGAEKTTKLFFMNVVKYWGVSLNIESGQDPRFTRNLGPLFKLVGT